MRRCLWSAIIGFVAASQVGCALMHDMQPHRLWRWNRGPAPSSDPYFSVSDPVPASALTPARAPLASAHVELGEPVAELD